jgi:putative SOS response-associated peptidase YedK
MTSHRPLGAELHDHHHDAERAVRADSQPHAEEPAEPAQLTAMLAPYPADRMMCWPVSARVGNVKNNDPSLVEPVVLA